MINSLIGKLSGSICASNDNDSLKEYCFSVKTLLNLITNLENKPEPFIDFEYFKETINFETYIGMKYANYEFDDASESIKACGINVITKEDIKNPIFKAMLISLMNIKLPLKVSVPEKLDVYEYRYWNGNPWKKLLKFIIQDGTLDKATVSNIMKFALLIDEIYCPNVKQQYCNKDYNIEHAHKEICRYNSIIKHLLYETNGVRRCFNVKLSNMFIEDLKYHSNKLPGLFELLEVYRSSKYYDEKIENLFLDLPVFSQLINDSSDLSIIYQLLGISSYYSYSHSNVPKFKDAITKAAEFRGLFNEISSNCKIYNGFISKLDAAFVNKFVNLVNNQSGSTASVFSTATMGALRRSKYEQRLSISEIEGFKMMSELSGMFENRKFAKSVSKYYTDTIL